MTSSSRSLRSATGLLAALSLLLTACGGTDPEVAIEPVAEPAADTEVVEPDPVELPVSTPNDPVDGTEDDPSADEPSADEPTADEPTADEPAPEFTAAPDADCSVQGSTVTVRPVDGMPAEVAAARDFLLDAAMRCDEQLLFTAIEESDRFSFSFGPDTDPIGHWWELEEAGHAPYLRLAQVLGTTPALSAGGDAWVWPRVTTGRAEDTTDEAWAELTWLEDPAAIRAAGDGYLDWRAGISPEGQWRFFVVGD